MVLCLTTVPLLFSYRCSVMNVMKKAKCNNVPKQNSKISDFFNKVPNNHLRNGTGDKRKLSDVSQSTESTVLNSVTNFPQKCSPQSSPDCKKFRCGENCIPLEVITSIKVEDDQKTDFCNVNNVEGFRVITPEKYIKPSSSMRTPTPKKSSKYKNKTPQSSGKKTLKKLFEKSPRKLEEFNVQVLEDFVKVSPSTSNKTIKVKDTPKKSNGIMQYFSPNAAKRSPLVQNYNETTPTKSQKSSSNSSKIKAKLNFSKSVDTSDSESVTKTVMDSTPHDYIKLEVDSFLEEDFEAILNLENNFNSFNLEEPQYCTILEVNQFNDKVELKLRSIESGATGTCSVEEFWSSGNHFKEGDTVYISAEKDTNKKWVVNNRTGWLVYEPNMLIPCTSVVGSLFCKRKSVLADRFRGFDSSNRIMIIGVLAHTLLQQTLKKNLTTPNEIEALLKNILASKDTIKKLYESNLTCNEIETELQTFIPKLVTFLRQYVSCDPKNPPTSGNWQGRICDIDDIEENLWCPELGIKGKIDVTVQTDSSVVPLELKTGRATVSLEHRGQVVLYIMMMNKLGYEVSSGLLLYLREGVLKEIKATSQEKRDVTILRNELAYFLTRSTNTHSKDTLKAPELPEPLYNHRACPKCAFNVICTSYLKFENHDVANNKVIQEVQKGATSHLSKSHLDYFLRWSNLLSMEAESNHGSKSIQQIYTISPAKREKLGRCIINVKVASVANEQNGLFEHTFETDDGSKKLTAYDIVENNYVVVSTEGRPAVATGFVTEISVSKVTILLDRDLTKKYKDKLFHLDTYDSNITFTFNMTSLALLIENTPRATELRNIIIDKTPPTFALKLPSIVAKKGATILKRLNSVQQKAVLKALCAKEFLLIKGMPGTGKSATLVALIQLLVELDKSVLITSHTHSAIDNICTRLQKLNVDFLRLGAESKIAANLKSNSEATLTEKCTSPEEMEEVYNKFKVLAVTCLGSSHPLLSKRTVDVCIVDESTQVVQTSVIKPLYAAKTFVLIGDPNQLAPVIKNRNAVTAGMSESLFERLDNSEGTITLNLNYRMNQTITDLANVLTYQGELKTANTDVANRTLKIPDVESVKASYHEQPWLLKALDTSLASAVQFIDTGPVWKLRRNGKHTECSDNVINIHEISIVVMLVKALIKGGVPSSNIGVIATYRAQVAQISSSLESLNVDVSTVDQFQGRDKPVIIYSCTKSAHPSKITSDTLKFELLEDKRRLTVAVTRAKCKLLIVGDLSTLQNYNTFSTILPILRKNVIKFDSQWTVESV